MTLRSPCWILISAALALAWGCAAAVHAEVPPLAPADAGAAPAGAAPAVPPPLVPADTPEPAPAADDSSPDLTQLARDAIEDNSRSATGALDDLVREARRAASSDVDAISSLLAILDADANSRMAEPRLPPEPGLVALVQALPHAAVRENRQLRNVYMRRLLVRRLGMQAQEADVGVLAGLIQDTELAEEAIDALARMRTEPAVAALQNAVPGVPDALKLKIIGALSACGARTAVAQLTTLAKDGGTEVRWAARDALSRLGVFLPDAVTIERDATPRQAARYAQACLRAALYSTEAAERAKAERQLLGFIDLYARGYQVRAVLLALARGRSERLVRTALSFVNTPDVRDTAIQVLRDAKVSGVQETLLEAYPVTDPSMQSAILKIMAARNPDAAGEMIAAAAASPHTEVRATAAWLRGNEASDDDLIELLRRGAPWARKEAASHGLAAAGAHADAGDKSRAGALYQAVLEGRFDADTRRAALAGLERIALPDTRPVIEQYAKEPELAEAASRALVAVIAAQEDGEQAQEELRALAAESPHETASAAALSVLSAKGSQTEEIVEQRGYITGWRVIGPFPAADLTAVQAQLEPAASKDPPATVGVNEEEFTWKEVTASGVPSLVDLTGVFGDTRQALAYAFVRIAQPQWQPADLWIRAPTECAAWLNGKLILERPAEAGNGSREEQVRVVLQPGINRLLLRVLQDDGPWAYAVRLTDRRGKPVNTGAQRMPDDGATGIGAKADQLRPVLGDDAP